MAEAERKRVTWAPRESCACVPVCLEELADTSLAISLPTHPLPDLFGAGGGRHQLLHFPSPTLDSDTLKADLLASARIFDQQANNRVLSFIAIRWADTIEWECLDQSYSGAFRTTTNELDAQYLHQDHGRRGSISCRASLNDATIVQIHYRRLTF